MDFITTHPLIFLALCIGFAILTFVFQGIYMAKWRKTIYEDKILEIPSKEIPPKIFGISEMIPQAICGIISSVSGILFLIGAIAYLLRK